ncbi:MAG: alpha-1,2-fucosyltransferase [Gammaproteobacteria bacterium]|nr:alpha-1,2-fucosyltransferase [Gammaproteobacteria bacterium]
MAENIFIEIKGGLGNQLFQYAAAYCLSNKLNCNVKVNVQWFEQYEEREFLLDQFNIDLEYATKEELESFVKKKNNFITRFVTGKKFNNKCKRTDAVIYNQPGFHYDQNFLDYKAPTLLQGYFQSEKYFLPVESKIRDIFKLKASISSASQSILKEIKSADYSVALHVRRGDYVGSDVHCVCPPQYYSRAIEILKSSVSKDAKFFVFSDDIGFAKSILPSSKQFYYIRGTQDNTCEDMMLMSACDNFIVANSSFSWWGAWLSGNAEKMVIAPKNWFARESMLVYNCVDLYPDKWMLM